MNWNAVYIGKRFRWQITRHEFLEYWKYLECWLQGLYLECQLKVLLACGIGEVRVAAILKHLEEFGVLIL